MTTRDWPVFDAYIPSDTGVSLNEAQFSDPVLQSDLFSLVLRFIKCRYVLTADMVRLNEEQCQFKSIFWRPNTDEEIKCCELNRLAPFLAV